MNKPIDQAVISEGKFVDQDSMTRAPWFRSLAARQVAVLKPLSR